MKARVEHFIDKAPNPVLGAEKDGTVVYSNEAGEPLLNEWGVEVGERLPSHIGDIIQRALCQNSPEKIEVKAGKKIYLIVFHPLPDEKGVNISGFDISDQKAIEEKLQESEEEHRVRRYNHILEGINWIFSNVVQAKTEEELGEACLSVALEVTGSEYGFIIEMCADGLLHDVAKSKLAWGTVSYVRQDRAYLSSARLCCPWFVW